VESLSDVSLGLESYDVMARLWLISQCVYLKILLVTGADVIVGLTNP
jgi:hypothetical protein